MSKSLLTHKELKHRKFFRDLCEMVASKMDPEEFRQGYRKLLYYKSLFLKYHGCIPNDIEKRIQQFSNELQKT